MKNFENESVGIDFKCYITSDDFKNMEDTPQEISKKIADLISDSDGYYYIYLNTYQQYKSNMQLIMLNGHRLLKKASKLVTDIKTYKRRTTNPRIWKDYNKHTMYLL